MRYSQLLKEKIKESGWSYVEVGRRCEQYGIKVDKAYLSRLCSGKQAPASDKTNKVLADVLSLVTDITFHSLRVAAYKEKIPDDVLDSIIKEELVKQAQ